MLASGSITCRVKPMTIRLALRSKNNSWFALVRITCPSGRTSLLVEYCLSTLALYKSNSSIWSQCKMDIIIFSFKNYHQIHLFFLGLNNIHLLHCNAGRNMHIFICTKKIFYQTLFCFNFRF